MLVPRTTLLSFAAVFFPVILAGKQTQFVTHAKRFSNVVPIRYMTHFAPKTHRKVHAPRYTPASSEMFHAFSNFATTPISNQRHETRNYLPLGGINPHHLNNLLSHLGVNGLDNLHRMPAVTEHLYGQPQKVIIKDHAGPPKKIHGLIQTFHTVKTIDNGGQTFGGTRSYANSIPEGDFSDYTGYEDFEFPPDW